MKDEQKPKINSNKPPEGATARQVAAWLRRGQKVYARNQAAEEVKSKAAQAMEHERIAEQKRQARINAIRGGVSNDIAIDVTPGKVASLLWMPQFKQSFRGFGFALALLLQIFAQALITVGLLPADHPARTLNGAKGLRIFSLLEEARLNLLPLPRVFERSSTPDLAGIRAFATRQYVMFSAIVGVLVTGTLSILFGLSRIIFYVSAAHAQTSASSTTNQSGLLVGFCPTTASSTSDFASSCLDNIFGTGAAGATASLVGSGLGTMFRLYSNMVLVLAGIIVLWIMISAVIETARTGVPFGKNFNSVWTPIRLIVALGLLVPLGSGMNSGQYIIVSLAKWGSQQATNVWNGYAQNLITSSTGGTQTVSGLTSVSFDEAQARLNALQMMPIATCEAIQNQICNSVGQGNCYIASTVVSPSASPTPVNAVANITSSGGVATASQIGVQPTKTRWIVPNGSSQTPAAGFPDCGAITVNLPTTASATPTTSSQSANPIAQSAQAAAGNMLNQSAANLANLETSLQKVASEAVTDAQAQIANGGDSSNFPAPITQIASDYNAALTNYLTTQEQQTIPYNLSSYNNSLSQALTQMQQQSNGWIAAPVWLTNIMMANGVFEDSVKNSGIQITPPSIDENGSQFIGGSSDVAPEWSQAQAIFQQSIGTQQLTPSIQNMTGQSVLSTLQNLTKTTSINPLAAAGTYGRDMLNLGLFLIQPRNTQICFSQNAGVIDPGTKTATNANGQTYAQGSPNCKTYSGLLPANMDSAPGGWGKMAADSLNLNGDDSNHMAFYPLGMVMVSVGLLLVMLTFLLLMRFISGVLNWIVLIFEAVLAEPLTALSLLSTSGDGFMTQQFSSNMTMLMGIVLRPVLMAIGAVLSIAAFNTIMQITNQVFAPSLASMPLTSDGTLVSLGVYTLIYGLLAYTLANSAFKLVDLMPNWVMNWIGARMESRVDDISAVQQQASGYVQTMAYARGTSEKQANDAPSWSSLGKQQAAEQAAKVASGSTTTTANPTTPRRK